MALLVADCLIEVCADALSKYHVPVEGYKAKQVIKATLGALFDLSTVIEAQERVVARAQEGGDDFKYRQEQKLLMVLEEFKKCNPNPNAGALACISVLCAHSPLASVNKSDPVAAVN